MWQSSCCSTISASCRADVLTYRSVRFVCMPPNKKWASKKPSIVDRAWTQCSHWWSQTFDSSNLLWIQLHWGCFILVHEATLNPIFIILVSWLPTRYINQGTPWVHSKQHIFQHMTSMLAVEQPIKLVSDFKKINTIELREIKLSNTGSIVGK